MKTPTTRIGWFRYYEASYNKRPHETAARLAMWYLLLHLAFDVEDDPEDVEYVLRAPAQMKMRALEWLVAKHHSVTRQHVRNCTKGMSLNNKEWHLINLMRQKTPSNKKFVFLIPKNYS